MAVQSNLTGFFIAFLLSVASIQSQRKSGTFADYRNAHGLGSSDFSENAKEKDYECDAVREPVSKEPYLPSKVPVFDCDCYYNTPVFDCPIWIDLLSVPQGTLKNEFKKGEGYCKTRLKYTFPDSSIIHRGGAVILYTVCQQSKVNYTSQKYLIRIKKAGDQQKCYKDEDCYVKGQQCSVAQKCYCSPLWAEFNAFYGCLPYSKLDESCKENIQCTKNAYCSYKEICECVEKFQRINNSCIYPVTAGKDEERGAWWLIPVFVILGVAVLSGVALTIFCKWRSNVRRQRQAAATTTTVVHNGMIYTQSQVGYGQQQPPIPYDPMIFNQPVPAPPTAPTADPNH